MLDNLYAILFLGLPPLGLGLFLWVAIQIRRSGMQNQAIFPLFFNFACYGAVLMFAISAFFHMWSGAHSIAMLGLIVVGLPVNIIQAIKFSRTWHASAYHRALCISSYLFPVVLASYIGLSFALGH